MRHANRRGRLNRTASHRKALFANLSCALITHEQIKTTLPKAKALRPVVEKLISRARGGSLADRRVLVSRLGDRAVVRKLIDTLAPRYKDRPGGYTRVLRAGFRYGDDAPMAVIELVDRDVEAKGARDRAAQDEETEDSEV